MKKIREFVFISFVVTMMALSMPASAQQTPTTGEARTENYDDDNDRGGNYSWIGLLGLIGLAGLAGKKRDVVDNRSTATGQPQTKYTP
jgi:hypothetical protein